MTILLRPRECEYCAEHERLEHLVRAGTDAALEAKQAALDASRSVGEMLGYVGPLQSTLRSLEQKVDELVGDDAGRPSFSNLDFVEDAAGSKRYLVTRDEHEALIRKQVRKILASNKRDGDAALVQKARRTAVKAAVGFAVALGGIVGAALGPWIKVLWAALAKR